MVCAVMLARSEVTGESTLRFGEARGLDNAKCEEKSWVVLLPNSVLGGCGIVSNIDIWYTVLGTRKGCVGVIADCRSKMTAGDATQSLMCAVVG